MGRIQTFFPYFSTIHLELCLDFLDCTVLKLNFLTPEIIVVAELCISTVCKIVKNHIELFPKFCCLALHKVNWKLSLKVLQGPHNWILISPCKINLVIFFLNIKLKIKYLTILFTIISSTQRKRQLRYSSVTSVFCRYPLSTKYLLCYSLSVLLTLTVCMYGAITTCLVFGILTFGCDHVSYMSLSSNNVVIQILTLQLDRRSTGLGHIFSFI